MPPVLQESAKSFYENVGANVEYVSKKYGHVFPNTLSTCISEDSVIGGPKSCGYDTVGEMFKHLLPNLKNNA